MSQESNLIQFPTQTENQAVLDEAMRRHGHAAELICGCCRLPFSEVLNGRGSHSAAAIPVGINIYSRHYGKTHTNQIKFVGVTLIVTDRKEFVIVPVADAQRLVA